MRTPTTMAIAFAAAFLQIFSWQTLPAQIPSAAQSTSKRPLQPSDLYRLQTVGDPQISPDGKWVAYTLSTIDSAQDKRNSDLWMVSWDGQETLQLTHTKDEGERSPRWSPDGKFLSFVSARNGEKKSQVWLLDRRGGEAYKLTDVKGDLNDYAWSPDGKRMVLTIKDANPLDTAKAKTAPPIVTERYHFKQDIEGYLWRTEKTHLYLFDLATKKLDTLTRGSYDDRSPVWSPDCTMIAFVSNRTADPDYNNNTDIWIIEAKPGAKEHQLTTWTGSDDSPRWSPDGMKIAYTRSTSPDYIMYDQPVLCAIPAKGGEPTLLSAALDRPVSRPVWAADGQSVYALITDDRRRYIGQFSASTPKAPMKIAEENRSISDLVAVQTSTKTQPWAAIVSEPQIPGEIFAIEQSGKEQGKLRRLTKHQEAFLAPLALASVEGFTSNSKDGAQVSGLLFRPAGVAKTQKLPLILFIHGGPVAQDEWGFDLTRQMLAAGGYAVAAVNYRGSNGRGLAYCKAISGDWGNKEVLDLHGAVDYLVAQGIADSAKLGVGGWSYGGILTDYLISADTRFKAAASGAGTALHIATYGTDQYIRQYEVELGLPWKNLDKWLQISSPFLKADRIKTPTLFMAGEKDFNVPAAGSEQLYQALRSQNVPTQLVIYPGQFHGLTTPSYNKDRFERYLKWFNQYLKP